MTDWAENERKVMESIGLSRQPGSGNGWLRKEDGESAEILAQLKSTEGKSATIRLADWNGLAKHALVSNKLPVFILQFIHGPTLLCIRKEDISALAAALSAEDAISVVDSAPEYTSLIDVEDAIDLL